MEQDLQNSIALLEHTPRAYDGLLRGLPEAWTRGTNGAKPSGDPTWSAHEIIAHVTWSEQVNWLPRAKWILEHNESEAFAPFNRTGYVQLMEGKSMEQLLDGFAATRATTIAELRRLSLTPLDLARRGTHPDLGSVTLSQLIAAWCGHDMTHLHQLSRTLAHQYREAVGPWIKYLGVLHCDAHGA